MALVLPSTVEEINLLQNSSKEIIHAFENIIVENRFKREISLPNGCDWNISNFGPYLNDFEENNIEVLGSPDDRLVPTDSDTRGRCASISSVSSGMEEKQRQTSFQNFGVKTFLSTVCVDSGSTCITDHSYVSSNPNFLNGLDPEETYQNLDVFLQEVPDISNHDTISSPFSSVPSPSSTDSSYELSVMSLTSQDNFGKKTSIKRKSETFSEDNVYLLNKQPKQEFDPCGTDGQYFDNRRKNNIASKNCRKTRKEKQKEMEGRVMDLEKDNEDLKVEVQVLEEMIQAHKVRLFAILQKR